MEQLTEKDTRLIVIAVITLKKMLFDGPVIKAKINDELDNEYKDIITKDRMEKIINLLTIKQN